MRQALAFVLLVVALTASPVGKVPPAAAHALTLDAAAQSAGEIARIGILMDDRQAPFIEAFRKGLRELGWVEGRNLVIELRLVHGRDERLSMLASELVGLGVDLLLVSSRAYIEAARQATQSIPIVFCVHYGPVEAGDVASLARPGGNVTGLTSPGPELSAKRLALLKEAVPGANRIAVLWTSARAAPAVLNAIEPTARALGVELRPIAAGTLDEIDRALASPGADALLVSASVFAYAERAGLADLAMKYRLPAMYPFRESSEVGGMMSYAVDFLDQFRRCAGYADKILNGATPADLPVEQGSKYKLVINLKTVRTLGLTIPPEILARADEVIE